MARGIDQVDLYAFVVDGNILGQNRNTSFSFQVVAIQDPFTLELRIAVLAALLKQAIDHRGLTMIDVSNNNNVADIVSTHGKPMVC